QGSGSGQGQGQGSGSGQGQGQGQGAGQGQGGSGQTQGGGGGATGPMTGSGGQGGQGGANPGSIVDQGGQHGDLDLQTVFDPPAGAAPDGEDVRIGGTDSGEGDETIVGRTPGQGQVNDALVPYLDVLAEYRELASRAIERAGYPTELRDLVRSYFDRISRTS
ncbi:MAG: hypothetical protein KY457_08615, partial [Actinobacteria bacterium]|nr:hypothetical protein [Actinomycetota bacterium]